jgi:hypothetical protein
LSGGDQTANRIDIDSQLGPLLADTQIHWDVKPSRLSSIPGDAAIASSKRFFTPEYADMQGKTPPVNLLDLGWKTLYELELIEAFVPPFSALSKTQPAPTFGSGQYP